MYHEHMEPDDPLLTADQVAAMLDISRTTWTSYVSRRKPVGNPAPQPLRRNLLIEHGHASPRWRKSAIIAWQQRRPSKENR
jgi:predicted DNA-binding transcriptional regulator AlpA